MQIAKKQLLGFGGLALVVAMTAFATTLPAEAVSTGGNVEVQVQVYGANFETVINNPLDGAVYNDPVITFSETHSHSYGMKYTLERLNSDGSVAQKWDIDYDVPGTDVSGTTTFDLNLNDYGGSGVFVFRSVITSEHGTKKEDAVQFTYKAIIIDPGKVVSDKNAIKFEVYYAPGTQSINYQLKNSKGEPISAGAIVNTPSPATGGYMEITVGLGDKNLESGNYLVEVDGYDREDGKGNKTGSATISFDYTAPDTPVGPDTPDVPDTPNVPDTGSIFSALNISRADYLITSLIAFIVISLAAFFIIKKAHKK